MRSYDHPLMLTISPDEHFARVSECYGPALGPVSLKQQVEQRSRIIAVLFWKLAQARGLVGKSPVGVTPGLEQLIHDAIVQFDEDDQ